MNVWRIAHIGRTARHGGVQPETTPTRQSMATDKRYFMPAVAARGYQDGASVQFIPIACCDSADASPAMPSPCIGGAAGAQANAQKKTTRKGDPNDQSET